MLRAVGGVARESGGAYGLSCWLRVLRSSGLLFGSDRISFHSMAAPPSLRTERTIDATRSGFAGSSSVELEAPESAVLPAVLGLRILICSCSMLPFLSCAPAPPSPLLCFKDVGGSCAY
jgi:hypothetical protein